MKTVLVVDDSKCIRDLLSFTLTAHLTDCAVLTAENGAKAVELFDASPVDAIMTDLSMPVMNGFQLMEHIRSRSSAIPIIAMTAEVRPDIDERLKSFGVLRCLEKPFDMFDVMQEMASVLGVRQSVALRPVHAQAVEMM